MDKNTIETRVEELNKASEAYYNTGQPVMSDAEFDNKLEELRQWEEETGIVLSNSPTHNVGATVLDNIKKSLIKHQCFHLKSATAQKRLLNLQIIIILWLL